MPSTTVRSKGTGPLARRAGIVCLIGTLAACSSGSHPKSQITPPKTSTPNTSTPGGTAAGSVREFFAGEGRPLIAFERATQVIADGTVPKLATCQHLTGDVLPKIIRDPNTLSPLARRIPDRTLSAAVDQDVRMKILVVLGCSKRQVPVGDGSSWTAVRNFANAAKRLLAQHGINV